MLVWGGCVRQAPERGYHGQLDQFFLLQRVREKTLSTLFEPKRRKQSEPEPGWVASAPFVAAILTGGNLRLKSSDEKEHRINSVQTLQPVAPLSLMAIIVLYKALPADSDSLRTLIAARSLMRNSSSHLKILLYDNTPGGQQPSDLPEGVSYEAASENRGLAFAYNRALKIAAAEGFQWLLTLDQDTILPVNFLVRLREVASRVESDLTVAAIVPQITGEGRALSPNFFLFDVFPRFFATGFVGISNHDTYAFNSASTVRVNALEEIGGYDPLFWLDNSDAYMYRQLHRHGRRVFIMGDVQVDHEFSMFDMKNRVSISRYKNIVLAGCAFWDLELGMLAGVYHTASLFYRVYKHWKRGDDPEIRRVTTDMLKKRLFQSRKSRIDDWQRRMGRA